MRANGFVVGGLGRLSDTEVSISALAGRPNGAVSQTGGVVSEVQSPHALRAALAVAVGLVLADSSLGPLGELLGGVG